MSIEKKVLLIEDDIIDQITFKKFIKDGSFDYVLTIADSVSSAKKILLKGRFDIIILDYSLGDGTAFDLLDLINDIPVIFTTGVGDEETAVRAMKAGVYDYIIKDMDCNYIKLFPLAIENALNAKKDKEHLKMLSQAIMAVNDNVYICDIDYKVQFTNNTFIENYGYTENEIIGSSSSILWDNLLSYENAKKRLIKQGSGEYFHKRKDGSIFPVFISRSIIKNIKGEYRGTINIARDISERKVAEENILAERDKAQSYLDIAGVIIIMIDKEQNISMINKKGCEVLGYEKFELIGKNWFDYFVSNDEKEDLKIKFNRWVNGDTKSLDYYENSIITKSGNVKIIAWHNSILRDRNMNITGVLSSGEDITIRMEIDKIKSEFINTVSHEIRTPLTVILGICQLLLRKDNLDTNKTKNYFNIMYNESKRLSDMVNDFLDIQRIENGRQVLKKEKMNLNDVIDETIELYMINTTHKIILDKDNTTYSPIIGDYNKLKQLMTNLVSNAIKYSPNADKVVIKVRETESSINVSIIDYGLGIPEKYIPNLFTKFYRVDLSEHRKIMGTGLGLALCKDIVLAHDGEIGVKSEVGIGSEFYFEIPKIEVR